MIEKLYALEKKIKKLQKKKEKLRNKIAKSCPHPKKKVYQFSWKWDDGYGKQDLNSGLRCDICGKEKFFYKFDISLEEIHEFRNA